MANCIICIHAKEKERKTKIFVFKYVCDKYNIGICEVTNICDHFKDKKDKDVFNEIIDSKTNRFE